MHINGINCINDYQKRNLHFKNEVNNNCDERILLEYFEKKLETEENKRKDFAKFAAGIGCIETAATIALGTIAIILAKHFKK